MALITLAQARAHCRVDPDYPAEQMEAPIAGAIQAAQGHLNRAVYESSEALSVARGEYGGKVKAAREALQAAREAARELDTPAERCAAIEVAEAQFKDAMDDANRCIHGIVINGAIHSAMLLVLGHLFTNRSAVVTGTISAEVHLGMSALLRPYRRVMMP